MHDDPTLLRRYVEDGSEAAFTELVRRNLDMVYAAALRRTGGSSHLAADAAQEVFTALAHKSRQLLNHPQLAAWLHTATRNAALNLMISEQRRRAREHASQQEAAIEMDSPPATWENLRPVLDAAIDDLPERDRDVVVLRFLKRQSFPEIGTLLSVSADAARVRTDRALDKLRTGLARRGITSTSAALAALVGGQPLVSAPAGLAAQLAASALATPATGTAVLAGAGLLSLMKTALTTLAVAILMFLAGMKFMQVNSARSPGTPAMATTTAPRPAAKPLAASAPLQEPKAPPAPTVAAEAPAASTVRAAVVNNLRQLNAALKQFNIENGRPPVGLLELVGPDKFIKRLVQVDGEDYSGLSFTLGQPLKVTTAGGIEVTFDPSAPTAPMSEQARQDALRRQFPFLAPDKISAIAPVLARYEQLIAQAGRNGTGILLPEEQQRVNDLKTEQHQALAALLSSDELLSYDFRTDQTALMLRSRVQMFSMSEDDARTIYHLQKAFDEQYGPGLSGANGSGLPLAERARQAQVRTANLPLLQQQIAAALGSERALDYKLASLPGAQSFAQLAARLQLSPEAMRQVLQAQAAFVDARDAADASRPASADERAQQARQLVAVRDQAASTVTGILGPVGTEAYKSSSGSWMTTRINGQ